MIIYARVIFLDSSCECRYDISAVVVQVMVLDGRGELDGRGLDSIVDVLGNGRVDVDSEEAQVLQLLLGDRRVHYTLGERQLGAVQWVSLDDLDDHLEVVLCLDAPCK